MTNAFVGKVTLDKQEEYPVQNQRPSTATGYLVDGCRCGYTKRFAVATSPCTNLKMEITTLITITLKVTITQYPQRLLRESQQINEKT